MANGDGLLDEKDKVYRFLSNQDFKKKFGRLKKYVFLDTRNPSRCSVAIASILSINDCKTIAKKDDSDSRYYVGFAEIKCSTVFHNGAIVTEEFDDFYGHGEIKYPFNLDVDSPIDNKLKILCMELQKESVFLVDKKPKSDESNFDLYKVDTSKESYKALIKIDSEISQTKPA